METIFLKILNMSITTSWLILAVVALRLLLKRAPKWLPCVLWALVAVRLMFPFSVESVFSLIPSAETVSPNILYAQEPTIYSGIPVLNTAINPVITESFAPELGASVNPLQLWTAIAATVWVIGIAAILIYAVISYFRVRRQVKASLNIQGNLWICDSIKTPFILGAFRPRIYLPSDMDEETQTHVVAHERAHLKRHDHWWKPLGFLLLAVYWFNPLCWVAYSMLCRDIELACDEKVIRTMETGSIIAYSEALFACSVPRRMVIACPLAFGEVGVMQRIKAVLNYKKPAFWIILLAVVACVVVSVCFLTNPHTEADSTPDELSGTTRWFDSLHGDELDWDGSREISIEEYPDVVFRCTAYEVIALKNGKETTLYGGMPIWSIYFCDLTGDGKPELCSTVSFGSGIVDNRIIVYDYAKGASYELADRGVGVYDYMLTMQDKTLYVEKHLYNGGGLLESGVLVYRDETLQIDTAEQDISYSSVYARVNYSQEGYSAMVDCAENRDTKRQYGNIEHLTPLVRLDTKADYDGFYEEMSSYFDFAQSYDGAVSFSAQAEGYTSDFFDEHSLFIAYLTEPSSSTRHELEEVRIENDVLELRICQIAPDVGDAAMAGWFLAVAIPKTDIAACTGYDAYICVSYNPNQTTFPNGTLTRTYTYEGEDALHTATIFLYDSGEFQLNFSPISSYIGYGNYVIEGERLTLHSEVEDYVFHMVDNTLVFDADASSDNIWYSGMTDGCVFR